MHPNRRLRASITCAPRVFQHPSHPPRQCPNLTATSLPNLPTDSRMALGLRVGPRGARGRAARGKRKVGSPSAPTHQCPLERESDQKLPFLRNPQDSAAAWPRSSSSWNQRGGHISSSASTAVGEEGAAAPGSLRGLSIAPAFAPIPSIPPSHPCPCISRRPYAPRSQAFTQLSRRAGRARPRCRRPRAILMSPAEPPDVGCGAPRRCAAPNARQSAPRPLVRRAARLLSQQECRTSNRPPLPSPVSRAARHTAS